MQEGQPNNHPLIHHISNPESITSLKSTNQPQIQQNIANLEPTLMKIQKHFQDKIIKDNLTKAVKKTLLRKNIIAEKQFKEQEAIDNGVKYAKNYVDRIQTWTTDSIKNNEALIQFEEYKRKRISRRVEKINSIMDLVDKIAGRLAQKKIQEYEALFKEKMEKEKIKKEENEELKRVLGRLSGIQQSINQTEKIVSQQRIKRETWNI